MKVSIFNCVSTAYEMLRFSTDAILNNAGTEDFDYIVVSWCATDEVLKYLRSHPRIIHIEYQTNNQVGYVPNLRGMMNFGFTEGFRRNEYCGLVNTDMYFGPNWLSNLIKYATPDTIVNSTHITPIVGPHVITANLNIPEYDKFNLSEFNKLYNLHYRDVLEHEDVRGGWLATNTMPYLIPKHFWEVCGPWELRVTTDTPDRRFFQRCHEAGAKFTMSRGSIVYHHEAVERRGTRPKGTEHLANEI